MFGSIAETGIAFNREHKAESDAETIRELKEYKHND